MTKKKPAAAAKPGTANATELAFDPVAAALKELFDDVAAEPVPDDFEQLIARLDSSAHAKKVAAVTAAPSEANDAEFKRQMTAIIPSLRAFARGLCRHRELADDLAQEALMRAWAARDSFTPGTNFRAWMFMIVRNHFYTTIRKNSRTVSWDPEAAERLLTQPPTQELGLHLQDVERALTMLPPQQREMLLLITAAGLSYEDAAVVAGCTLGTVKSRLARARAAVQRIVSEGKPHSGAPDTD